jgi:ABC-type nitrate/sulfonate/bicarbonate transport system permease component
MDKGSMIRRFVLNAVYWYPILLALAGWELLSKSGLINPLLTPSLGVIGRDLLDSMIHENLSYHAELTIARVAVAFLSAIVLGVTLGSGMALSGKFEEAIEPLFSFAYPLPKIALYPIIVFLFGIGTAPKIALTIVECMYPIAVGTYQGLKLVDQRDIWAARMMGAKRGMIYFKVLIPRAAPYILSSLRVAAHVALAVMIILEMIGDSTGLGYYVSYAAASFEFGKSYAAILIVVLVGFALDRGLIFLRRKIVFWEGNEIQSIG